MNRKNFANSIKNLRKEHHLTQQQLADKYDVSFQAVSKWENGRSLPELVLLRKICSDYDLSIDKMLGNERVPSQYRLSPCLIVPFLCVLSGIILLSGWFLSLIGTQNQGFEFKIISSACNDFEVAGSLSYDTHKSAIQIAKVGYHDKNDSTIYRVIECVLYEQDDNLTQQIGVVESCETGLTLSEFLQNASLSVSDYHRLCENYKDGSLFLAIHATDATGKVIAYHVPLRLNS